MNLSQLFASIAAVFFAASAPVVTFAAGPAPGTVKLPEPSTSSKTSVEGALRERRSIRKYRDLPLTLSEVSQILWAAQGISGTGGRRTAPSAGALYPLELYLVAGNVSGLEPGVYLYKPGGHELVRIAGGDKRAELRGAARGLAAITDAAADLVISAVYERTTVKYGERGNRYVHMEAGHAAENVYLQAVSLGLGTVALGAFDDQGVSKAAELTIREQPLCIMPLGRR